MGIKICSLLYLTLVKKGPSGQSIVVLAIKGKLLAVVRASKSLAVNTTLFESDALTPLTWDEANSGGQFRTA